MGTDESNLTLTPEEKFAAVATLKKRLEDDFVALGGLLSEIKRTKAFRLRGYKSFKDFVEHEYNMAGGFAIRLIGIHDLFVRTLDQPEERLTGIGLDKLSMIRPVVTDCPSDEAETWINKAEEMPASDLREEVKDARDAIKKKTNKKIFVDQYIERMTTVFNCSRKELDYKLAIYFQDADLDQVADTIRAKRQRIEDELNQA